MTEEVYEEEEAAQAAEDPNTVINVRELAHDTGRCDPVPFHIYFLLMSCWQGMAQYLVREQLIMTAGIHHLNCELCHAGTAWQSLAGGAVWPVAAASACQ